MVFKNSPEMNIPVSYANWQEKVLNGILKGILIIGFFTFLVVATNLYRNYRVTGNLVFNLLLLILYLLFYLAVVYVSFIPRSSFQLRVGILLAIFYILGLVGLLEAGLFGDGRLFLFGFIILAVIFLDLRFVVGAVLLSLFTILGMGWIYIKVKSPLLGFFELFPVTGTSGDWISGTIIFLMIGFTAMISLHFLMEGLKRSLIQSQEAEQKYRTLVETSPTAIVVGDQEGNILYINDFFVKMHGWTDSQEFLEEKRNIEELVAPECHKLMEKEFARLIKLGGSKMTEYRLLKKNGTLFPAVVSAALLYDGSGQPDGFMAVAIDISELKKAEEKILKNLREKEILLQEVHHRVKNNLNVITSLLNLQASRLKENSGIFEAFMVSRDRIRSMALVHEKLYQSGDYAEIHFREYIETMSRELRHIYDLHGNVAVRYSVEDIVLDINTSIPCGLILNELLTNAFKHGFPDGKKGRIVISLKRIRNNRIELVVRDNGVGLPGHFSMDHPNSLGMKLVSILTEQINGRLTFSGKNGTRFRIVIPPAPLKSG